MISELFRNRIGVVTIAWSKFVDRNGIWAKAPETCSHVQVHFVDAVMVTMTYDEYKTLPPEQKELIRFAPSSQAV